MNCPKCNRNNAVTLSICPSCGTMINDSVREELQDKISPIIKPLNLERKPFIPSASEPQTPAFIKPSMPTPIPKPQMPVLEKAVEKIVTAEISVKHTAPTLVEFHSKNSTVPEWRLQLQNAV